MIFRSLLFFASVVGFLQPAFAGKITIDADLDISRTQRIQKNDPTKGYDYWVKQGGYWQIESLGQISGVSMTYDYDAHKFVIIGLTPELIKENLALLRATESDESVSFLLRSNYTQYTVGKSEYEPKFRHKFFVKIVLGNDTDQTVLADLQEIEYTPPHNGGISYPSSEIIYSKSKE